MAIALAHRKKQSQTVEMPPRLISFLCVVLSALSLHFWLGNGRYLDLQGSTSIKVVWSMAVYQANTSSSASTASVSTTKDTTKSDLAGNATVDDLIKRLTAAGLALSQQEEKMLADVWSNATNLYYRGGSGPIIIGKERCGEFRRQAGEKATVTVAGLFNSGTNALFSNMKLNIGIPGNNVIKKQRGKALSQNGIVFQPPWWKHNPKVNDPKCGRRPDRHRAVLPVVIIRDPLFWRKSMCSAPYTISWKSNSSRRGTCPRFWSQNDTATVNTTPVTFKRTGYCGFSASYESLVDVWNQFYSTYLEADFPRLIVRAEDALFYTPEVIEEIRLCAGAYSKHGDANHSIYTSRVKGHGNDVRRGKGKNKNPYLAALQEATSVQNRLKSMNEAEQQYTRQNLDPHLMSFFHYVLPGDEKK